MKRVFKEHRRLLTAAVTGALSLGVAGAGFSALRAPSTPSTPEAACEQNLHAIWTAYRDYTATHAAPPKWLPSLHLSLICPADSDPDGDIKSGELLNDYTLRGELLPTFFEKVVKFPFPGGLPKASAVRPLVVCTNHLHYDSAQRRETGEYLALMSDGSVRKIPSDKKRLLKTMCLNANVGWHKEKDGTLTIQKPGTPERQMEYVFPGDAFYRYGSATPNEAQKKSAVIVENNLAAIPDRGE